MENDVNHQTSRPIKFCASGRSEFGSYAIVMACDEAYAMPLAVALRSMAEANRSGTCLDVVVLTAEFSADKKRAVEASVPTEAVALHWVKVDLSKFNGCSLLDHISRMTYARLLLPYVLPEDISRVLYLDADILVLDDPWKLLKVDLEGAVLGAVIDIDSELEARRLCLTSRLLSKNDKLQAVEQALNYFNAGVLLIDLPRWREEQISERAIQYLAENPRTLLGDQDALNAVCLERWKQLDGRWNLQRRDHADYPDMAIRGEAGVIHFWGSSKPWRASSLSGSEAFYDKYRSRTKFVRTKLEKSRNVLERSYSRLRRRCRQSEFVYAIYECLMTFRNRVKT